MVSAVETQKLSSDDQETKAGKQSDCEEQQEQQQGNEVSEKVVLKKPDKILPCPRCNSMDTKFCYYNNYNVNQPRHFCKKCQRYWTAGGTMRNVPVGAVRRKNKNSAAAAHYHHLTCMSDPIPVGLIHHHHSTNLNPTANGSGNIRTDLSFGSDTPLCDSMASVLKLGGKTVMNSGFPYPAEQIEEQSTGLLLTASNSNSADERTGTNLQERAIKNCQMFTPQVPPYINGSPWPYPWTPAHHAADMVFSASSFAVPFYPAAPYRGCSTWSTPWPSPLPSPSPTSGSTGSGPNSPTLGKHSREGDILNNQDKGDSISVKKCSSGSSDQEKCLWIPKTLRIHDPEAASKSSFWASMGFKNDDKSDALGGRRVLFKPFQTKAEPTHHKPDTSQLFYTNPAAMSRSINFQETS